MILITSKLRQKYHDKLFRVRNNKYGLINVDDKPRINDIAGNEMAGLRRRINRPYPTHKLQDVLPIAMTIHTSNASIPMDRELLASALGTTPSSSGFRMRLTSSAKYKLTVGGYKDDYISLTELGRNTVAPKNQIERRTSLIVAASNPETFGNFYKLLNGKSMPEDLYAENVLARELRVHPDLAPECLEMIIANGLYVGIIVRDGNHLAVKFELDSVTDVSYPSREQSVKADASNHPRNLKRGTVVPRIFVGFYDCSKFAIRLMDNLRGLGLNIYQSDLTANLRSLTLPTDLTDVKDTGDAGILITKTNPFGKIPDPTVERGLWMLLGAAKLQFSEKVVLVCPFSELERVGMASVATVALTTENIEAVTLDVVTTLMGLGVISLVANKPLK